MNELQPFFEKYVKYYIEILTKGKNEFFLSLCDIEEEFLEEIDCSKFLDYKVVVVDSQDYSEAVRFRNDICVKQIVLLSGEGVKQIDSLKDFNEYSVLSQDRTLMWECLEKTFQITLVQKVRGFLEGILEQSEISFADFFSYMKKSIVKKQILPSKLNQNLSLLGIWKSKDEEVLKKPKIKKMISNSHFSVVDNRLTSALMNHKIGKEKLEEKISAALSRGDIQNIFSSVYYEEAEDWLKQAPKGKSKNLSEVENLEEKSYWNLFEYKLSENLNDDISKIEQEWMADLNSEDTEFKINWNSYHILQDKVCYGINQMNQLIEGLNKRNLPFSRKEKIEKKLLQFSEEFLKVKDVLCEATPVCLATFCDRAKGYTQIYFELLSGMVVDGMLREMDAARGFAKELLMLFCIERENGIRMPYYHPIRVFYYMKICNLYELISIKRESDELKNMVWSALVDKIAMQFPVEFIKVGDRCYTLDSTTILNGYTDFISVDAGTVYSVMDFKIVQQQIMAYIMQHPYLTSFTICLMDISDLSGLSGLITRIRELAGKEEYNIGRVDFLIISSKEEELKKMLSKMWDTIGADDIVRFRFSRNAYISDGKYNLNQIIKDADMTIMADNALLYQDPLLIANKDSNNSIYNRIKEFDIEKQAEYSIRNGKSDISILWDTMQSGQEGFWRWKSRELDSKILEYINQMVSEQSDKSIIILSSNEHILSEIYQTQYMQAFPKKYNGKSITILCFGTEKDKLSENVNDKIVCSLSELYDEVLGLEEMTEKLLPGMKDIVLEIWYERGKLFCCCIGLISDEGTELSYNWEEPCKQWLEWQFHEIFQEQNVLTNYFMEVWRNHLNTGGSGIFSTLLVEMLCRGESMLYSFKEEDLNLRGELRTKEADCTQAVKVHEILQFVKQKPVIDERTVSQFRECYDCRLLQKILETESSIELIDKFEYERLMKLEERIRDN